MHLLQPEEFVHIFSAQKHFSHLGSLSKSFQYCSGVRIRIISTILYLDTPWIYYSGIKMFPVLFSFPAGSCSHFICFLTGTVYYVNVFRPLPTIIPRPPSCKILFLLLLGVHSFIYKVRMLCSSLWFSACHFTCHFIVWYSAVIRTFCTFSATYLWPSEDLIPHHLAPSFLCFNKLISTASSTDLLVGISQDLPITHLFSVCNPNERPSLMCHGCVASLGDTSGNQSGF